MSNRYTEIRGIIFDFDFTLADSLKGVVECVNYALKKLNFIEHSEEKIKKTIGLTLENTFNFIVDGQYPEESKKFKKYFIERADEIMADSTYLFDETYQTMKLLRNNGFKLGIVSTKFRYRIIGILKREDLLHYFDVIIGAEDVEKHKPDPRGLMKAIKRLNLSKTEIIYVGDSLTDAETASNAGVPFIATLSGITSQKDFKNYPVVQFIKNVSEIPKLLRIK
ncbi:MAG: HAD family hydrolase [Candidatus Thorarchaeota archaeon]